MEVQKTYSKKEAIKLELHGVDLSDEILEKLSKMPDKKLFKNTPFKRVFKDVYVIDYTKTISNDQFIYADLLQQANRKRLNLPHALL